VPNLAPSILSSFATDLLAAGGMTAEEAAIVGPSLANANTCGYSSHGVMRIPFYLDMLKVGDVKSNVELTAIEEGASTFVGDANWGIGRVQCGRLLDHLVPKAKQYGNAIGTLRNSGHIGRLGEYCEIAANEHGLVSMLMVNTHGAARRVAPPGGIAPRLGTNPIAIGVPRGNAPLILDFSTSVTAEGKVRVKSIAGESIPEGWIIDSDGNPSTNPDDLYTDPPGTILPMGGDQSYKGFGLSLMIDIFSGALSAGLCARETPLTPKGNCVFLMVIDPARLGGVEAFQREVNQISDFVKSCPTRDPNGEILLPGDPERKTVAANTANGIAIDDENWSKLTELAQSLSVDIPQL